MNLGPDWAWLAIGVFAIVGALAAAAGIIWGIVWLCMHVRFV